MRYLTNIFELYAKYTGESVLMVLFFVSLIYVALQGRSRSTKTVLLYGTVALSIVIFCPLTYYVYSRFVDDGTYWRVFWMIPVGIGLAFSGTKLINEHRASGFLLALFILVLGGRIVYSLKSDFRLAPNPYQLSDDVIDIADYLEEEGISGVKVAVAPELLSQIRQYDVNIMMPYGREQYEKGWGTHSGFFEQMQLPTVDFEILAEKCRQNTTKFIVINKDKKYANEPEQYGFIYKRDIGDYNIYEFEL